MLKSIAHTEVGPHWVPSTQGKVLVRFLELSAPCERTWVAAAL